MGYDLHITRRRHWSDEEPRISMAEWEAYVSGDSELHMVGAAEARTPDGDVLRYENPALAVWQAGPTREVWFDYRDGCIVVKNPDEPTISKMVAIAEKLRARVQGDDGEVYPGGESEPSPHSAPSLVSRIAGWFRRDRQQASTERPSLGFGVGDRVRDARGQMGTVASIDLDANLGLGSIRVRFDDGRLLDYSAIAHDLERA